MFYNLIARRYGLFLSLLNLPLPWVEHSFFNVQNPLKIKISSQANRCLVTDCEKKV